MDPHSEIGLAVVIGSIESIVVKKRKFCIGNYLLVLSRTSYKMHFLFQNVKAVYH